MYIACPVVESREEESFCRGLYDPVADPVLDIVRLRVIGQTRLGKVYRADAAHDVLIDCIGGIEHLQSVGGFARHVVYSVNQYYVIVFGIVIVIDDIIVELLHKQVIFQFAVPQFLQSLLRAAF